MKKVLSRALELTCANIDFYFYITLIDLNHVDRLVLTLIIKSLNQTI